MRTDTLDLYVTASAPTTGNKTTQLVHDGINKWVIVLLTGAAGTFSSHFEGSEDGTNWASIGPTAVVASGWYEIRESVRYLRIVIDNAGTVTAFSAKLRLSQATG